MMSNYDQVIDDIISQAAAKISEVLPSEWAELNRQMTSDVSAVSGMFRFDNSPYTREILDRLSQTDPARILAIMKGAQIGFSTSVIENAIGWVIATNPGNILFLVGHDKLIKDSMDKIDKMLDGTGIRHLIRSATQRTRNNKSGDTDHRKDFAGGYLSLGIAHHKTLRNISMQYGFIDDYEAMKPATKEAGSMESLIMQRFAAFKNKMKVFLISTPELKATSNIEPAYLRGDQRKYHVPCPCCSEMIVLEWEIKSEVVGKNMAGMTWKLDESGELIPESVGYICPKCDGFFDDSNKTELIRSGSWVPTAKAKEPGYFSYHISALYAPNYMFGWDYYVRWFLRACPVGGKIDEAELKAFKNLCLGEAYEPEARSNSAIALKKNVRNYEIGVVPGRLSEADGNGKIVMLTLGSDANGTEDDARIDYEIRAWSESGASYSVLHGSVGTFILGDRGRTERTHWTYKRGVANSVWPEFLKIMDAIYQNDLGNRMKIMIGAFDTGYLPDLMYPIIDGSNGKLIAVKGDPDRDVHLMADAKTYKQSKTKGNLFIVESNLVKDRVSDHMALTWEQEYHEAQPPGFMNFPFPSGGLYSDAGYFSHFEAEHKVIDKGRYVWKKKSQSHQNHLFDCYCYNVVARDILMDRVLSYAKIKNGIWADYVGLLTKKK